MSGGGSTTADADTPASGSPSPCGGADDGGDNDNRLAPYNPTHATARAAALDLLALTPHDALFDLGCGDGRLLVSALERCYDGRWRGGGSPFCAFYSNPKKQRAS